MLDTQNRLSALHVRSGDLYHLAQLPASGTVEVVDGEVRGNWYVLELNHLADGSGVLHLGHYRDTYVRTDAGWRFATRRFHLVYRGAMDSGTVHPLHGG